jgi:DNA-3-methyladenine glycosylase II
VQKAIDHFNAVDPMLGAITAKIKLKRRTPHGNHFRELVEAILSQQLSVKASDTITARMVALFPGKDFPTPQDILAVRTKKLRSVGVSGQKAAYLKDLAEHVLKNKIDFKKIASQSDEEVIVELVAVKGIGRWTAEMFLMFSLGRPDVFSAGDLGLRNAMNRLYGKKTTGKRERRPEASPPKELTLKEIERISARWSPYRTLACRYLWASLSL